MNWQKKRSARKTAIVWTVLIGFLAACCLGVGVVVVGTKQLHESLLTGIADFKADIQASELTLHDTKDNPWRGSDELGMGARRYFFKAFVAVGKCVVIIKRYANEKQFIWRNSRDIEHYRLTVAWDNTGSKVDIAEGELSVAPTPTQIADYLRKYPSRFSRCGV